MTFRDRFLNSQITGVSPFDSDDILQSLVISHGDARLAASVPIVGTDFLVGGRIEGGYRVNIGYVPARRYGSHRIAMRTGTASTPDEPFRFTSSGGGYGYLGAAITYDSGHVPDYAYLPDDAARIPLFSTVGTRPDLAINAGAFALGRVLPDSGSDPPGNTTGPFRPELTRNFDNGVGPAPDGAYINMPDGGDSRAYVLGGGTPYFDELDKPWQENSATFFPLSPCAFSGNAGLASYWRPISEAVANTAVPTRASFGRWNNGGALWSDVDPRIITCWTFTVCRL